LIYLAVLLLLSLLVVIHELAKRVVFFLSGPLANLAARLWLAILNLLPIPVLDGGQIVMGCLESAFPPLVRFRAPLTLAGLILLGTLMVFVNLRDVAHYIAA
jgi:Zn-dependent protease